MKQIVGSLFGVVFGLVFVVVGVVVRENTKPFEDGVIVEGVVIEVDRRVDSDGDTTYSPIVEFVDPATGQTHVADTSFSSSSRPTIGEAKDVSLRPGEPFDARIIDTGSKVLPWAFIGMGALVVLLSGGALLFKGALILAVIGGLLGRSKRIDPTQVGRQSGSSVGSTPPSGPGPQSISGDAVSPFGGKSSRPAAPAAAADWYVDPDDSSRYRYWNGSVWTDDYAPVVTSPD